MQFHELRRREFITFLGAGAAWPFSTLAQQRSARIHRIFWASTEAQPDPFVDGFREGLRELGYVEGNNLVLQLRYAPGNPDALRSALSELTRDKVDLAVSSGPAIRAMKAATNFPSYLRSAAIRSNSVLSRAWPGRAATSRAVHFFRWIWLERELSC